MKSDNYKMINKFIIIPKKAGCGTKREGRRLPCDWLRDEHDIVDEEEDSEEDEPPVWMGPG